MLAYFPGTVIRMFMPMIEYPIMLVGCRYAIFYASAELALHCLKFIIFSGTIQSKDDMVHPFYRLVMSF